MQWRPCEIEWNQNKIHSPSPHTAVNLAKSNYGFEATDLVKNVHRQNHRIVNGVTNGRWSCRKIFGFMSFRIINSPKTETMLSTRSGLCPLHILPSKNVIKEFQNLQVVLNALPQPFGEKIPVRCICPIEFKKFSCGFLWFVAFVVAMEFNKLNLPEETEFSSSFFNAWLANMLSEWGCIIGVHYTLEWESFLRNNVLMVLRPTLSRDGWAMVILFTRNFVDSIAWSQRRIKGRTNFEINFSLHPITLHNNVHDEGRTLHSTRSERFKYAHKWSEWRNESFVAWRRSYGWN